MKVFWKWIKQLPLGLTIPIGLIMLVCLLYTVLFVCKFASCQLSNDPTDWANTANYFNLLVSVSNMIVFVGLSLLVYQYNVKKDRNDAAFQSALAKPILVFSSQNEDLNADGTRDMTWKLKNIGNGPALNMWVTYKKKRKGDWELPVAKCYSLAKDDTLTLDRTWINGPDVIVVLYKDTFGNGYGTVVIDDENYVENLDDLTSQTLLGEEITVESLRSIYTLEARRLEDIIRAPIVTSPSTSTTETTRREE